MEMREMELAAYTDAASFNNGKKDSRLPEHSCSAALLVYNGDVIYATSYHNPNTSISYGELFAIYMILTDFSKLAKSSNGVRYKLSLYSDSAYCVQSLNTWIKNWKKKTVNGIWNTSTGPVAYQELLGEVENILNDNTFEITIRHIKGHTDVDKPKDMKKARDTWERFNTVKVSDDELATHVFFNNVCDRYVVQSLKEAMGGRDNDRVRKKFKKYIHHGFK